jgi:hypothetical protein
MDLIRARPRLSTAILVTLYLFAGISVSDVESLELSYSEVDACPDFLLPPPVPSEGSGTASAGFTILQGNLWMFPSRPLLVPYAFSTDRRTRLERLVSAVRACRPTVVLLQEVFEQSMVELLAHHLPEYRVLSSGETEFLGAFNASGLVTLTRLPVSGNAFHAFSPLPEGMKRVESIAQKGFLAVDVVAPGFEGTILNLHLYSSRDSAEAEVTRAQLEEVVAFVEKAERRGRRVLVGGDFNIPRSEMIGFLPEGWAISEHGPTYNPPLNPYTVEGYNNTPANHEDRRLGRGVATIDLLLSPPGSAVGMVSQVLDEFLISDHQFIQHRIVSAPPLSPYKLARRAEAVPPDLNLP